MRPFSMAHAGSVHRRYYSSDLFSGGPAEPDPGPAASAVPPENQNAGAYLSARYSFVYSPSILSAMTPFSHMKSANFAQCM